MVSAWVFVVWGNPKYLVGAIAGAASLRQVGTVHHVVLLWAKMEETELMRELKYKGKGEKVFDLVEETELLRFRVNPLKTDKQMELYGGEFSETANTKWQCLALEQYQKVMFMDSDIIFRRNCDSLFSLPAPAATFSSPFSRTYGGGFPDPYRGLRHGEKVAENRIRQGLRESTVAAGSMVLLEPSKEAQAAHIEWMRAHEPYGHPCYSAIDEQAITEFMLDWGKKIPGFSGWTHIEPRYQAIPWKNKWCPGIDILDPEHGAFSLHFYHSKIWEKGEGNDWPDTVVFWCMWHKFAVKCPKIERLTRELMEYYVTPKDMPKKYGQDKIKKLCKK
jgi:hypothetical protein